MGSISVLPIISYMDGHEQGLIQDFLLGVGENCMDDLYAECEICVRSLLSTVILRLPSYIYLNSYCHQDMHIKLSE